MQNNSLFKFNPERYFYLKKFFDIIAECSTFQLEKGSRKGKLHYQGGFILSGARVSKNQNIYLRPKLRVVRIQMQPHQLP